MCIICSESRSFICENYVEELGWYMFVDLRFLIAFLSKAGYLLLAVSGKFFQLPADGFGFFLAGRVRFSPSKFLGAIIEVKYSFLRIWCF